MKPNQVFRIILLIGITLLCLALLQKLLIPKFQTGILEGALIGEYYQEENKNHDVIFIGDCEVYEDFSPVTLWEEFGITSFIRGSAQQLIWQSYYLLEDTLRYEKPAVVIFNVLAMKYGEPQNEAYNRMTLDAMPLTMTKLRAIQASMLEEEDLVSYIFPFLRYHSRWSELTGEDFTYLFQTGKVSHNGYLMRTDVKPVKTIPTGKKLADYQFSANSYLYLDKITALCQANGIKLILIKSPSIYPYWYKQWDEQMVAYAAQNELLYVNCLDYTKEIGIDFATDTYDAGLHMNLSGAEKMSRYFGRILTEQYALTDRRGDAKLKALWAAKADFYHQQQADQFQELATYGYLRSFKILQDQAMQGQE